MVKIPSEEERKSVREFFGITNSLDIFKPIPCNAFINLVKIYSLLPDQQNNPFAKYTNDPDYAHTYPWPDWILTHRNKSVGQSADGVRDNSVPRGNTEASNVSVHSSSVEVGESSGQNETNSDITSRTLCKDTVFNGPELAIDELGMSKNSEMLDKSTYGEDGTNAEAFRVSNVHEDLSSIQRILMDESDDPDMLQLLDKDVNLDFASDFGSILDMDRSRDKSLTMESIDHEEFTAIDETKRKGVEADRSTSEGNVGISQAWKSVDSGMSSGPEFVNQNVRCLKDARIADTKLCEKNVRREVSETGGLPSIRRESESVGKFSFGKSDDILGKRNRVTVCGLAKGKRTKVKNAKTKSEKNVESGKRMHSSYLEEKAENHMRSGGDDQMVHGKTVQQSALATSRSPSTKEDKESWPKGRERVQFTREELLNLGKTAFIPEHIKKAAREIGVEIHEKQQISAAFKVADSGILKKKRGGSVSEAKKEKKKLKKRKKRAELNRQLGVKRLKLQPNVKPKVVQHCRHYLMGRCYEGEKCKFSHDVVPLTKSKPCCHFARQACMKGDECPFDHELSKYPCNSFADTGFCSRGDSCLFSHKIPVKAASEPSTVSLKCDASSVGQRDLSKSKLQADTIVTSTSAKATPKNLKATSATQTIKPAVKPKGLSFYSFGTSQLDASVQPKESDMSKQSNNTGGTNVQPKMVAEAAPDLRKTPLNIPGSGIQGTYYPSFEKTSFDSSRHHSSGKPLPTDSSIYQLTHTSGKSDQTIGTPTPKEALESNDSLPTPTPSPERATYSGSPTLIPTPTLNLSERALDVPEISKGNPTPNPTATPTPERALKLSEMLKGTSISTATPTATATPTPTPTSERAISLSKMLKGTLTSTSAVTLTSTPTATPTLERALNSSEMLKGTPTPTLTSAATATATLTPTSERALNLSELLKSALTQTKAKGIGVSSVDVPATNISHGKSGSVVSTEQEKGNINASEKSKEVQPEPGLCGSQSSSGKISSKIDFPLKKRPDNSQRALQSALAFASKHESGIKTSSMTATKENNLNDGTSSGSVRQSQPLQASKILQFLNRKENK